MKSSPTEQISEKRRTVMPKQGRLVLEDGTELPGTVFGYPESAAGEVVFNTGMVGYPESLSDPSYRGQILVFTYPLIGNYGVPALETDEFGLPKAFESDRAQISGVIVSEVCHHFNHHGSSKSLPQWLADQGVPGLADIDTRALTKHLREKGSMLGKIIIDDEDVEFFDPNARCMAPDVATRNVIEYKVSDAAPKVVLIDCGVKVNIIRSLLSRGLNVVRVPHDYYFLNMSFDGVVISNGPGDPRTLEATVKNVKHALAVGKPMLGICMGIQMLALAVGAETYKLRFGHRSHNQPCVEQKLPVGDNFVASGRCYITSQNHGFAVRGSSLSDDWRVWFVNANDNTVAGIRHVSRPVSAVQFHPEATPGPKDTDWIFDEFVGQVKK